METKMTKYREQIVELVHRVQDVRVIGLVMFGFVVLLMTWSGIKVIGTNYTLQKQIAELQQQNAVQNLSNTNMKLSNEYYQTDQYLEIMARQNFGMAAPGETVFAVPKAVALSYTVDRPDADAEQKQQTESKQPTYQRNFQAWMNFLFHRQQN